MRLDIGLASQRKAGWIPSCRSLGMAGRTTPSPDISYSSAAAPEV